MNYRHAYHAGNFADVLKHVIFVQVLAHLRQKPAPFRVVDTHAGPGVYDLGSAEAGATLEWMGGIGRIIDTDVPARVREVVAPYLELLAADRDATGKLVRYPGSPLIARRMLRSGDVLVANELHPQDHDALADLFHRDGQVRVMAVDGYAALKATLPPKERRGVVLVDPPFEEKGEFDRLLGALRDANRRFATGTMIVWYPVKDRAAVDAIYARIETSGIRRILAAEVDVGRAADTPAGLSATGVLVVNPPFTLHDRLGAALPWLAAKMAQAPEATGRIWWLVQET